MAVVQCIELVKKTKAQSIANRMTCIPQGLCALQVFFISYFCSFSFTNFKVPFQMFDLSCLLFTVAKDNYIRCLVMLSLPLDFFFTLIIFININEFHIMYPYTVCSLGPENKVYYIVLNSILVPFLTQYRLQLGVHMPVNWS